MLFMIKKGLLALTSCPPSPSPSLDNPSFAEASAATIWKQRQFSHVDLATTDPAALITLCETSLDSTLGANANAGRDFSLRDMQGKVEGAVAKDVARLSRLRRMYMDYRRFVVVVGRDREGSDSGAKEEMVSHSRVLILSP